ncbi:MAG: hypothetical protein ACT4OX_16225 [Actinomycetota bacterium]
MTISPRHTYGKYCGRRAWYRGHAHDEVLIERRDAERLAKLGAAHLVRFEATRGRDPRHYLRIGINDGAALRSPVPDVPVRVWWKIVRALLDGELAGDLLSKAMTADGFSALAPADLLERCRPCHECGEVVLDLGQHQRLSSRCRWSAAANRVNELWVGGYRDPWTVRGGAPLTWSELRASSWRKRLTVVEFRRFNAALVTRERRDCVAEDRNAAEEPRMPAA